MILGLISLGSSFSICELEDVESLKVLSDSDILSAQFDAFDARLTNEVEAAGLPEAESGL